MHKVDESYGYTGTGLSRVLRVVAGRYYHDWVALVGTSHLITLALAGLAHPWFRHDRAKKVQDHKLGGRILSICHWGHSQGAVEAAFQTFRTVLPSEQRVKVLICLSGPFDGSPAACAGRFLKRLPRPFRDLFEGILQMMPGSDSLEHLQLKIARAAEEWTDELPHVYLVAAHHDGLVPAESAWRWPENYPADKVHLVLLAHGEVDVPPNVTVVQTSRGMDNHVTMIWSSELREFASGLLSAA